VLSLASVSAISSKSIKHSTVIRSNRQVWSCWSDISAILWDNYWVFQESSLFLHVQSSWDTMHLWTFRRNHKEEQDWLLKLWATLLRRLSTPILGLLFWVFRAMGWLSVLQLLFLCFFPLLEHSWYTSCLESTTSERKHSLLKAQN